MVPFFLGFLVLPWGWGFAAFAGGISTGISSSLAGGEERADSVSDMFALVGCVEEGRSCRVKSTVARQT